MVKEVVLTLILIFILSMNLLAEETPKAIEKAPVLIPTMGFGLGLMYQINMAMVSGNNYFCIRRYGFDVRLFGGESYIHETAFLYGRTLNFNTKTLGYLALSAGPGMIESYWDGIDFIYEFSDDYNYEKKDFVGLATDLNFTKGITNQFGYGFNLTVNINEYFPYGGLFFSLYLGNFKNNNYDPTKVKLHNHVKSSAKVIDKDKINETEKGKEYVSIDFNLFNFLAFYTSYKVNVCWEQEKTEWVIPFQYKKANLFDIYDLYDELTLYGLKSRNYMGSHGWYFDLGMDVFRFHLYDPYDESNDDYQTLYNIAISLGNKAYLSEHFYIRNQLNMHIPIAGDDVFDDGYGMNSGSFYMDFEFLVLGLTF